MDLLDGLDGGRPRQGEALQLAGGGGAGFCVSMGVIFWWIVAVFVIIV